MGDGIETSVELAEAAILPRRHEAHANPKAASGEEVPQALNKKPVEQKSPAEWAYERIILYIQDFEQQLDNEHEVAMGFTGGDAGCFGLRGWGFSTRT